VREFSRIQEPHVDRRRRVDPAPLLSVLQDGRQRLLDPARRDLPLELGFEIRERRLVRALQQIADPDAVIE
jgi:hypothetical protein